MVDVNIVWNEDCEHKPVPNINSYFGLEVYDVLNLAFVYIKDKGSIKCINIFSACKLKPSESTEFRIGTWDFQQNRWKS